MQAVVSMRVAGLTILRTSDRRHRVEEFGRIDRMVYGSVPEEVHGR